MDNQVRLIMLEFKYNSC